MNREQLESMLSDDQKAAFVKASRIFSDELAKLDTEQEIGVLYRLFVKGLETLATNKVLRINGVIQQGEQIS